MRYFRSSSRLAIASLGLVGLCASGSAHAQTTLVFDNFDNYGSVQRGAGSSFATVLNVATTTTIDRIGVNTNMQTAGNYKFLIFNDADGSLLFSSAPKVFGADTTGDLTEKDSNIFSFTLLAGSVYDIGYISDVDVTNGYTTGSISQHGLSSGNVNSNFSDYDNPTDNPRSGTVNPHLRLYVQDSSVTPEGSSLLMLCGGLLPLGGLGLWHRRRSRSQS